MARMFHAPEHTSLPVRARTEPRCTYRLLPAAVAGSHVRRRRLHLIGRSYRCSDDYLSYMTWIWRDRPVTALYDDQASQIKAHLEMEKKKEIEEGAVIRNFMDQMEEGKSSSALQRIRPPWRARAERRGEEEEEKSTAQMAAEGGGGRDRGLHARTLLEDEHYAPWDLGNKNKNLFTSDLARKKEGKLLSKKGIDLEDIKEFILEKAYESDNHEVTKKNLDIVKKLNSMRILRIQWLQATAEGASKQEIQVSVTNMSNLKKQIIRLQGAVRAAGGAYVPIPDVFASLPES